MNGAITADDGRSRTLETGDLPAALLDELG